MALHSIKANFNGGAVRHEFFEGREHLVVPVVMICEGVLNDALVPLSEFSRYPEAWNGRPVPVMHPQQNGMPISANRPDVIERNSIGSIFNASVEGAKLKAEAWIDTEKARRLGHDHLVAQLAAGQVIEVSTGYFSDDDPAPGSFNGMSYSVVHRNLRPDHLALLPGEIGACSIEDGCGTRVNSKKGSLAMKVNEAWAVITKSLGLKPNCQCKENSMDILEEAKALVKANALDAKQLAAIQQMAPEDRQVMAAFISALGEAGETEAEPEVPEGMEDMPPEEEKPPVNMKAKEQPKPAIDVNSADFKKLIANEVKEGMRRERVLDKLTANSACAFDEKQLAAMDTGTLETYEKSIRPADYSGQGGFATNSSAIDKTVTPLIPRGVLRDTAKKEA